MDRSHSESNTRGGHSMQERMLELLSLFSVAVEKLTHQQRNSEQRDEVNRQKCTKYVEEFLRGRAEEYDLYYYE